MISAPACYGKLPALGDYLRHRAPGTEVGLWWNRFGALPATRGPGPTGAPAYADDSTRAAYANGADATDAADSGEKAALPWCFVLAPDVFSWASGVHVIGVLMRSRDRIGRPCPLVVWHKATPAGLRHAALFGTESPRNWLFWLSRLVLAHVRSRPPGHDPASTDAFPVALDRLWALFRPSWTARFGAHGVLPPEDACRQAIGPCPPLPEVEGVRFMPRADWPEALWSPRALCWFWQQDHTGRYLRVLYDHHCGKQVMAAMLAPTPPVPPVFA